ncbi:RNA polymerase sigma-70 factor [Olivibacter sp. CPCC 100613]|uniref:RNA polymerase sigma-70 factor n=1 Tax=Olivibacter sp. CPCC 100613 TaxID=3079931 RepID=UPI002FF58B22
MVASISTNSEQTLLKEVVKGNTIAFEQLFYGYHQHLTSFIYKLSLSKEVAADIVQDAFIEVWLRRHLLAEVKSFKSFLFVIAKNKMLNELRKLANEKSINRQWAALGDKLCQIKPVDDDLEEYYYVLERAIECLPPQQRKVLELSKFSQMKHRDIALLLNVSEATVKTHVKLAFRFLRRYFHQFSGDRIILAQG